MISGNDNNKQESSGRSQSSSPLGVKEIKRQVEKGMKEGLEKGMGYKGAFKNIPNSEPVKGLKREIWKRAEKERERMEHKGVADYQTKTLKEEYKDDKIRIKDISARQAAALKHKEKSAKEAEKEMNKRLKEMGAMQGIKRKTVSKAVGKATSEMAYQIAQKMSAEANKGGVNAIVIIAVTFIIAIWIDLIDILTAIALTSIIGAVLGFVIWLSNLFLSLVIVFFWMAVLGGGHKKWFWKMLIRLIVVVIFVEQVPYLDLIPWTLFTVSWNSYDFFKSIKKAKKDETAFQTEFRATGKINAKHAKNYA